MKMNKFIKTTLAGIMIISAIGTTALASEPSDEVINDLCDFKIVADKADIRPNDNVTRAEAVKMICIAQGNDVFEGDSTETQRFTDVPTTHWAARYIEIATIDSMIDGYDDGTFKPENNVTYQELQKMIVSALGYDLYAEGAGGYPDGYLTYSNALGVSKGLEFDNNDFASRGDAMQMIYNALDAPIMEVQGYVESNGEVRKEGFVYDGKSNPFISFRKILNGEVEY